jgi:hypothetical protein
MAAELGRIGRLFNLLAITAEINRVFLLWNEIFEDPTAVTSLPTLSMPSSSFQRSHRHIWVQIPAEPISFQSILLLKHAYNEYSAQCHSQSFFPESQSQPDNVAEPVLTL